MKARRPYFMGYQERWLADKSRFKIAEKSRRIGWTYVQAYEDTVDAAKQGGMDVWFTSADISAAREYIRYVEQWAKLLHHSAEYLGEVVLDEERGVKALVVEFANGKRINALSSNPKGFRSKGGKVVIDEYAFHESPDEMWKAASPSITWGFSIRVFSSHNGKATRFYRMCEEARQAGSRWSLHTTTIEDAIADGLVERVMRLDRPATEEERQAFRDDCRAAAGDDETYQQEYMCNPLDGSTQYIPWDLIVAAEDPSVPAPVIFKGSDTNSIPIEHYRETLALPFTPTGGLYYLGMDIGRERDLSVIWLDELLGDVLVTRLVWEFHVVQFRHQFAHLALLAPIVTRGAIDETGIGKQLAEDARLDFGERFEAVTFSNPVKEDLAVTAKRRFEDRTVRNPNAPDVRGDIAKIKKTVTSAGNTRYAGERTNSGHADRWWARALAIHAATSGVVDYEAATGGSRDRLGRSGGGWKERPYDD